MGQDQDDGIFIPLSTFQTRMQRGLGKFVPGQIFISAVSRGRHSARAHGNRAAAA